MIEARETAVVTGGAQGIGGAIVRRLAEDGFRVLALDLGGKAEAYAATLRDAGLDVTGATCDVADRAAVAQALAPFPTIEVTVCAAGIYWPRKFDELVEDDFRRIMEVNLIGVFVVAQEALKKMGPGGRIIPISSRGVIGGTGFPHYVASKAAVVGLVRAMAMELRGRDIAVNSIAPGFTDTAMTRSMPPDQYAASVKLEPSGRAADPADIANAVSFLASPRTAFITGQIIYVDGGKSLGGLGI
jgi:3-oxoacyl-[acyl-carrier protein] reductase